MLFFLFVNLLVLAAAAAGFWWLSAFDVHASGHHADRVRRGVRCGVSLLFTEGAFICLWQYWRTGDRFCGFGYLVLMLPLALIWMGCVSELYTHGFRSLLDPDDDRKFDPDERVRNLDAVAALVRSGRREEAIQRCRSLKESGDASVMAMDTLLEQLGAPEQSLPPSDPVKEAAQLRRQARFPEAESVLKSLLQKNPGHVEAAMMLMRIYSQDLRQPAQARLILQTLKQQPHVSAAVIEFAERSLYDWDRPTPPKPEEESLPDSVEELLARRLFGTAIELLKRQLKDRPNDFELTLKLAEIQACHCQNPMAAEKIVRQMEGRFSRDQIQTARARLKEWQ